MKELSPAAEFLIAGKRARSSKLGDREYAKMMHDLMIIAIETRMQFDFKPKKGEGMTELECLAMRLDFRTSVGVFRVIQESFYSLACLHESSYALAYQVENGLAPWKIAEIYTSRGISREGVPGCAYFGYGIELRRATKSCKPKVAPDLMIKVPGFSGLYRCTAVKDEIIRFVSAEIPAAAAKHFEGNPGPSRISFSREKWAEIAG